MRKGLIIQSYYELREVDDHIVKMINKSIENIYENRSTCDYKFFFGGDESSVFLSKLNIPEGCLVLIDRERLDSNNFDTIKVQAMKDSFIMGYDYCMHIDSDVFLKKYVIQDFIDDPNPVSVPWEEFSMSTSFRRVKVSNQIAEELDLPVHQSTRLLGEYNICIVKMDRSFFASFYSKFYELLNYINTTTKVEQSLVDYYRPYFPFQVGLYEFLRNKDIDPVIYKDTYLRQMGENYFIITSKSLGDDFLHFGGLSKYSNLANSIICAE